jgi:hypothetical protein
MKPFKKKAFFNTKKENSLFESKFKLGKNYQLEIIDTFSRVADSIVGGE